MGNSNNISNLYQKYLDNTCNLLELQELLLYFEKSEDDGNISHMIRQELEKDDAIYESLPQVNAILQRLDESINANILSHKVKKKAFFSNNRYTYWSAAALFLLVLSVSFYYANTQLNLFNYYASEYKNDVAPGTNRAYLTLSNGKKIELTDSLKGTVATQSGVLITKTANGQLRYQMAGAVDKTDQAKYNTISTPMGGKYEVILSDGTLVFLNAGSSISFPTKFNDTGDRRVVLQGEGYFEVTHKDGQAFYVESRTQVLKVLGTHFNVNAYSDEKSVRTTLLEGSVKVSYPDGKSAVLVPGQQSHIADGKLVLNMVKVEDAVDWKRGDINMQDEDFQTTMRKIARWYDVDVFFDEGVPADLKLGGVISREKSIITVLKVLELTGKVHFKVEGRRVTVMR